MYTRIYNFTFYRFLRAFISILIFFDIRVYYGSPNGTLEEEQYLEKLFSFPLLFHPLYVALSLYLSLSVCLSLSLSLSFFLLSFFREKLFRRLGKVLFRGNE